VIGGGPAGTIGGLTAARLRHSVALVDSQAGLGGLGSVLVLVVERVLLRTLSQCATGDVSPGCAFYPGYQGRQSLASFLVREVPPSEPPGHTQTNRP
jgi:hypothetical protein